MNYKIHKRKDSYQKALRENIQPWHDPLDNKLYPAVQSLLSELNISFAAWKKFGESDDSKAKLCENKNSQKTESINDPEDPSSYTLCNEKAPPSTCAKQTQLSGS